ncbi:TIGR03084 family metal-binding protein [Labedaea rhizosphaerae]|uniref:Uncharacterized protein (TIGR03084 family) n=1 Tax=Labedaea rhizosphaerae TaxID=598644 RepID=A0A4R6RZ85_LABRH|nr:TIGR03084 family metal-binding protein [Labedaea rhizosphaerae]TDP91907.1 uncharacterized protein (TIGR03084 family) [Labedaea rhizosphaerae]
MTEPANLWDDLAAETADLDALLASVTDWDRPTPAIGWSIRDQVSHLAYFDEAAALAIADPARFRAEAAELVELGPRFPDVIAERHRAMPIPELLNWFRLVRTDLLVRFRATDPKKRVPWYGPDMSALSSATARLMETWAHGQDVADALGVTRPPTARLRHVAHLGVRTFGFSFGLRGKPVPDTDVFVELTAPDGDRWTWGDPGATERVHGPALDFCLVVTQRRHRADTALTTTGSVAAEWLTIAQAFAGAPGPGREPVGRRTA